MRGLNIAKIFSREKSSKNYLVHGIMDFYTKSLQLGA